MPPIFQLVSSSPEKFRDTSSFLFLFDVLFLGLCASSALACLCSLSFNLLQMLCWRNLSTIYLLCAGDYNIYLAIFQDLAFSVTLTGSWVLDLSIVIDYGIVRRCIACARVLFFVGRGVFVSRVTMPVTCGPILR